MNKSVSELTANFDLAFTNLANRAHEMSDALNRATTVEMERDLLAAAIEERTVRMNVLLQEL